MNRVKPVDKATFKALLFQDFELESNMPAEPQLKKRRLQTTGERENPSILPGVNLARTEVSNNKSDAT
jgi:hypothetical protein